MLTIRRESLDIPQGRRILAVSDIHGHVHFLKNVLERAGFCEADELIIDGDIIEKGPYSLETLRYVMELGKLPNVHVISGNVDCWQLELIGSREPEMTRALAEFIQTAKERWGGSLFLDFCDEMGIEHPRTEEETAAAKKRVQAYGRAELEFLSGLPSIVEAGNFIFVHGGLPNGWEEMEGQEATPVLKFDDFRNRGGSFDRCVVAGHWPVCLYRHEVAEFNPLIDREKNIISIDGGCGLKRDGQLNCLMIGNPRGTIEEVSWTSYGGFPEMTAVDGQKEQKTRISIQYTDNRVELLAGQSAGPGLVRLRHLTTDTVFAVPKDYLYERDGTLRCDDFCDYHMEVKPGERVELVEVNALGSLIKKNGVSSWYHGRLELAGIE